MNTIAERIKFAMNVRNVKQVEMVQRTGITKGAFSSYLSGNYNPKKDKLELIADALDININWLMGENAPMENSSASVECRYDLRKEHSLFDAHSYKLSKWKSRS